jgi:tRNA G18 (ribose-2'-O)-methylase SpoU
MTEERDKKLSEYFAWMHPFAVAVYNISKEFNIGSLLRTVHCAKGKEFFLIGDKSYNTYAAVSSDKWTKVNYFEKLDDFLLYIKDTDYNLVLVEQSENSKSMFEFEYPANPLFVLGMEKGGLPDSLTKMDKYPVLEIPQFGLVHSLNLSCSGSIVIYHYLYELYKDKRNSI